MKHTTTSACRGNDRLSSRIASCRLSLLTMLFVVLSLGQVNEGWAQALTKTNPQTPNAPCDEPYTCCTEFTIAPHKQMYFTPESHNSPPSTSADCFDWACFEAQSGGGLFLSNLSGNRCYIANFTDNPLNFTLCGDPDCMLDEGFSDVFWDAQSSGAGTIDLEGCGNPGWDACLGCDRIRAWPDESVCITRSNQNSCVATSITFNFSPALPACVRTSGVSNYPAGWQPSIPGTGGVSSIIFTWPTLAGPGGLGRCESFCFKLPHCCDDPLDTSTCIDRTYQITGLTYGGAGCLPPNTACTGEYWALKPVAIGNSTYQLNANTPQNYPNPLSESGEFKTVIPFEVSSASDAVITIIDETGRKVFEDMMEVKSSGKHSFNFTGDQLPAGKYFYSIESPKGVVIVQKSMLIVR